MASQELLKEGVMFRRCELFLFFLVFVLSCESFFCPNISYSNSLPLPESAKSITKEISDQCEECLAKGFSPTGTDKIGFGKNFFQNFFLGSPEVGILVSHIVTGKEYEKTLREHEYEKAKRILLQQFANARVFVIERKSFKVNISGKPEELRVVLTKELHQCLHRSTNPLCCCCTADCKSECCEKGLGSTYVLMKWKNPLNPEQSIEYTYYPHLGDSRVYNVDKLGNRKALRWCLDSQGAGFLK